MKRKYKKRISVRITPEEANILENVCTELEITKSEFVRQLLTKFRINENQLLISKKKDL